MDTDISSYMNQAITMAIEYAPKFIMALVVLIVGLWIINKLVDIAGKAMEKSGVSEDIRPFLSSLIGVLLKVLLLFSVAGMVGIETTSFVAMLAAAGFAIGMALQGSLGNFAAGVMVLVFKPYKVGDVVKIEDEMGHVKEIQIFNTLVKTFDNRTVIIPNGTAIGGIITNLSTEKFLRVDLQVAMPYAEDSKKVIGIIKEALKNTPKVMQDPEPFVGIEAFDSHYVTMAVRPYAMTEDYWDVYFAANEAVKNALGKNGIKMAYSEGVELGDIGL